MLGFGKITGSLDDLGPVMAALVQEVIDDCKTARMLNHKLKSNWLDQAGHLWNAVRELREMIGDEVATVPVEEYLQSTGTTGMKV